MEENHNIEQEEAFTSDQEVKPKSSRVFTEPYSKSAINRLKDLVLKMYAQGERKYYAILVDGEFVVKKNSDGRKFDRYLPFVSKETREIEVRLHQGYSFNHNKYIFVLKKSLSGLDNQEDVQAKIDKALEEQKMENELADLKFQLAKKEKKLKKYKEKSMSGVDQFGKVVENGAKIVSYIKGLSSGGNVLQGAPNEPNEEIEDSEIEFIDEEEKPKKKKKSKAQGAIENLFKNLDEIETMKIVRTMSIISQNPDIHSLVNQELKKKQQNQK